ncbi:hypothetical protein QPL86_27625 (plasmid) [Bacillus bombysepticus]|nr:hypothetical protein QPL86_27625 [Bacillus bombysepticus]
MEKGTMLYVIGFILIAVVAIRLNMKYYKLKGDSKNFVERIKGSRQPNDIKPTLRHFLVVFIFIFLS